MAGETIKITFAIHPDSYELLKTVRDRYGLPDTSKALRCLLDYSGSDEADWDLIFNTVRCRRCG
jgi:hypothetical protein